MNVEDFLVLMLYNNECSIDNERQILHCFSCTREDNDHVTTTSFASFHLWKVFYNEECDKASKEMTKGYENHLEFSDSLTTFIYHSNSWSYVCRGT